MKLVLRRVDLKNPLHVEGIAAMFREVFTKGQWGGRIRPERGDWWVALAGGKEAAFAGMVPSHQLKKAGYLCAAGVLPAYRGHGLQKRLIRVRIAQARKYGWTELRTETLNDNAASANSLIACGFRQFNPAKPWAHAYSVYWQKFLRP